MSIEPHTIESDTTIEPAVGKPWELDPEIHEWTDNQGHPVRYQFRERGAVLQVGIYNVCIADPRSVVVPPPEPHPPPARTFDPHLEMTPQIASWTCSACALDWVLRATGIDPASTRDQVVEHIGYPENINEEYGLMDAAGSALRRVLSDYGVPSEQAWLDFDTVYALAQETTGQMSGASWYHWVALRGVSGDDLWIANSAPGYKGVYDLLSRADFDRLGGFSVVWLA